MGGILGCYSGSGHLHPPSFLLGGGVGCSGGSTSSFQRLRLTDVGPGARPPRLLSWGLRPGKGALSRYSHSWGLSPQSFPQEGVRRSGGNARGPASVQGLQEALGSQPSLLPGWGRPRSRSGRAGTRALAPVSKSPGFNALSTCLGRQFTYLQSEDKPRRGGARERTHHHSGDRLAGDVGHLDRNLATKRSSVKPAAKIPAAAPSLVNKGNPTRPAPS